MPRDRGLLKERLAERIIESEERDRGRRVRKLGQQEQRRRGFDFEVTDNATGEVVAHIEVKAWGESLLNKDRHAHTPSDLRTAQWRASADPRWRIEIVGNLDAVLSTQGRPQRLTLRGGPAFDRRVTPRPWDLWLDGLEDQIVETEPPAMEGMDTTGSDTAFWDDFNAGIDDQADADAMMARLRKKRPIATLEQIRERVNRAQPSSPDEDR